MSASSQYKPEYDYKDTNYKALGKPFTNDMCGSCKKYYKNLFEKGITKTEFPPQCSGHIMDGISKLKEEDFESLEEFETTKILMDPVSWAKLEFDWDHRWYQNFVSSCTARKKVLRGGRRSGKSRVELVLILHEMATLPNRKILLLCPSEKLLGEFFDVIEEFLANSRTLKYSTKRKTKNPHILQLKNGSKLTGISVSPKDPNAGDKVRGFDADLFVIDESEMFKQTDMEAIMALLVSSDSTRVMVSSTPKGWRKTFYKTCANKDYGYKEFWWISAEKPDWTTQIEAQLRDEYSEAAFTAEFYADFGDLEDGAFRKHLIEASLRNYDTDNVGPEPGGTYILGVDWNKSAGNHMTILQVDGRTIKFIKKVVTPQSEFMHTKSVEDIINLQLAWRFKYIFVDAGYGHTNVELLKKWGNENPASGMLQALNSVYMNQDLEVKDPKDGNIVRRRAKPYLVDQTVKLLEDGCLILPINEDYGNISEKNSDVGLVEQMRNFRIERYSVHNLPSYSQGNDHTLTAYMLACAMWVNKEGPLKELKYSNRILSLPTATSKEVELTLTEKEMQETMKNHKLIRSTGKVNPNKKPPSVRDLDRSMRSLGGPNRNNPGRGIGGKSDIKRKTF